MSMLNFKFFFTNVFFLFINTLYLRYWYRYILFFISVVVS